jgi:hypothetical protein
MLNVFNEIVLPRSRELATNVRRHIREEREEKQRQALIEAKKREERKRILQSNLPLYAPQSFSYLPALYNMYGSHFITRLSPFDPDRAESVGKESRRRSEISPGLDEYVSPYSRQFLDSRGRELAMMRAARKHAEMERYSPLTLVRHGVKGQPDPRRTLTHTTSKLNLLKDVPDLAARSPTRVGTAHASKALFSKTQSTDKLQPPERQTRWQSLIPKILLPSSSTGSLLDNGAADTPTASASPHHLRVRKSAPVIYPPVNIRGGDEMKTGPAPGQGNVNIGGGVAQKPVVRAFRGDMAGRSAQQPATSLWGAVLPKTLVDKYATSGPLPDHQKEEHDYNQHARTNGASLPAVGGQPAPTRVNLFGRTIDMSDFPTIAPKDDDSKQSKTKKTSRHHFRLEKLDAEADNKSSKNKSPRTKKKSRRGRKEAKEEKPALAVSETKRQQPSESSDTASLPAISTKTTSLIADPEGLDDNEPVHSTDKNTAQSQATPRKHKQHRRTKKTAHV